MCEVSIKSIELKGDEYYIELKGTEDLRKSLTSYGVIKKIYSHERVYGQSHEGPYRQLFRYSILCQEAFCAFTFSPKKAI